MALVAAVFAIWLFPEFVVAELTRLGAGPGKRFNLTVRFWLEGYYLIPFLVLLVWAPAYPKAFTHNVYNRTLGACAILLATLWLMVNAYSVTDRIRLTSDEASMDGAAFLKRDYPHDTAIVKYLQSLPGSVRIGELCGTGDTIKGYQLFFDWPGRIAAFSGRPGICGWSIHVWQFSNKLRHEKPTGPWTWVRFREYERNMKQAFDAARQRVPSPASRAFFESLSVTHMVVGEGEQKIYPGLTIDELASALGGTVVYRGEGGTGVLSLAAPQLPAQSD
ncbi:MAG: hypothetical protein LUO80_09030 [Methylococcaceae bacterium]|nr:hypothetical protein [Methylococcaceae bacterium]